MKIKSLLLIAMFCLPCLVSAKGRPINELPMYGGKYNPSVEQDKKVSEAAARVGWQYYYRDDLDTAMKRFNQAWMFDRNSIDALWGFGLIMGRRASQEHPEHNLKESFRFLGLAVEKSPQDVRILVDLAFSHTVFGQYLNEKGKTSSRDELLKAERLNEKRFPPSAIPACSSNRREGARERGLKGMTVESWKSVPKNGLFLIKPALE